MSILTSLILLSATKTNSPIITSIGTIDGSFTVDGILTVLNETVVPSDSLISFQWLRNGASISGANNRSYTVVSADSGTNLSVRLTANNAFGSSVLTSSSTLVVVPSTPDYLAADYLASDYITV